MTEYEVEPAKEV